MGIRTNGPSGNSYLDANDSLRDAGIKPGPSWRIGHYSLAYPPGANKWHEESHMTQPQGCEIISQRLVSLYVYERLPPVPGMMQ